MSTALTIVIIAVIVLALLALLAMTVFSPKRRAQRRLAQERQAAAEHHRAEAEQRNTRADVAEQRAREARLEADRVASEARLEREQAQLHDSRAELHERGLADDELDHGRTTDGRMDPDDRAMTHGTDDAAGRQGRFDRSAPTGARADNLDGDRERFEEELAAGGPDATTRRTPRA